VTLASNALYNNMSSVELFALCWWSRSYVFHWLESLVLGKKVGSWPEKLNFWCKSKGNRLRRG